jgi:hypothetical protein
MSWQRLALFFSFPIERFLFSSLLFCEHRNLPPSIAAESSNIAESSWTAGADLISVSR